MVIKRFDPELANRVFLEMGRRELEVHPELRVRVRLRCSGSRSRCSTHFVTFWWLLPLLGVVIGYVTNWVALWMIFEPPEWRRFGPLRWQGLFVRRQREVANVYASIVADDILTVAEFGNELLYGPALGPHPGADRVRDAARDRSRRGTARVRPSGWPSASREYDAIREAFASEPIESVLGTLTDPSSAARRATTMRKLIAERMRKMAPRDFAEMLRTATREDEWLLLLHGAVLGFAGGLVHLAIFG